VQPETDRNLDTYLLQSSCGLSGWARNIVGEKRWRRNSPWLAVSRRWLGAETKPGRPARTLSHRSCALLSLLPPPRVCSLPRPPLLSLISFHRRPPPVQRTDRQRVCCSAGCAPFTAAAAAKVAPSRSKSLHLAPPRSTPSPNNAHSRTVPPGDQLTTPTVHAANLLFALSALSAPFSYRQRSLAASRNRCGRKTLLPSASPPLSLLPFLSATRALLRRTDTAMPRPNIVRAGRLPPPPPLIVLEPNSTRLTCASPQIPLTCSTARPPLRRTTRTRLATRRPMRAAGARRRRWRSAP